MTVSLPKLLSCTPPPPHAVARPKPAFTIDQDLKNQLFLAGPLHRLMTSVPKIMSLCRYETLATILHIPLVYKCLKGWGVREERGRELLILWWWVGRQLFTPVSHSGIRGRTESDNLITHLAQSSHPGTHTFIVELTNLLLIFEWCLIINNSWKTMSFTGYYSLNLIINE